MSTWLTYSVVAVVLALAGTALFFFTLTRGALLMRGAMGRLQSDAAHVYTIYTNIRQIRLVDYHPNI